MLRYLLLGACLLLPAPAVNAQCIEGNCTTGTGVKITRGHKYAGEFKDNHRHGTGLYAFPNGDRYEGEFEHGIMSGEGIYYYKNGDRYEGEFADNAMDGVGRYYTADGHVFSGVWENGVLVQPGQEVVSEDLDDLDADALLREVHQGDAEPEPAVEEEMLDRMVDDLLGR